ARIQEEEALVLNVLERPDEFGSAALYTRRDALQAVAQLVPLRYGQTQEVCPGVAVRLVDAGHILGSAMAHVTVAWGGRERSLTFTGDLAPPAPARAPPPGAGGRPGRSASAPGAAAARSRSGTRPRTWSGSCTTRWGAAARSSCPPSAWGARRWWCTCCRRRSAPAGCRRS